MKNWLKAIKNCAKNGLIGLVEGLVITALLIGAGIVITGVGTLVFDGIAWLLGPTVCAAISGFMEKNAIWVVVGIMVIAGAAMAIDAVVTEKKSLDWRDGNAGNDK